MRLDNGTISMPASVPLTVIVLIAYFLVCGRGLFEAADQKVLGYVVQSSVWALVLGSLAVGTRGLLRGRIAAQRRASCHTAHLMFGSFVTIAVISTAVTIFTRHYYDSWVYLLVSLYFAGMLWVVAAWKTRAFVRVHFGMVLALVCVALITTAVLEQLFSLEMPGQARFGNFVRPASLTGSKQHYAITLALIACAFVEMYRVSGKFAYLFFALAATGATALSFTRSGPAIVGVSLAYVVLVSFIRGRIARSVLIFVSALVFAAIVAGALNQEVMTDALSRLISAIDTDSEGNPGRLRAWYNGIALWSEGILFVGDRTGVVTQTTARLLEGREMIQVESGVLQQLINFGLLGLIAYYGLWLAIYQAIDDRHIWLRGAVVGGAVQSFVYMSVEVVPFMITIAMLPLISDWLRARYQVVRSMIDQSSVFMASRSPARRILSP